MFLAVKEEFNNSSEARVARLLATLDAVPAGQHIAEFIRAHQVAIRLEENPVNWAASTATITGIKDGLYSYKDPVIIFKASLSDDNILQAIVHETQHLRQHFGHAGNPDHVLSEEEYILFYRAAEADAQATCTDVAWQLKEAGLPGAWDAARYVGYGDISDAYKKAVEANPDAAANGDAKRAAFNAWFDDPHRLAGYNEAIVDWMIPFLAKGREIFKGHNMTEGRLDATWLQRLNDISPEPYLAAFGAAPLQDPRYRKDLGTRPPAATPAPARPANDSANNTVGPKQAGPAPKVA